MTPRLYAYRRLADARQELFVLMFPNRASRLSVAVDVGRFYDAMVRLESAAKRAGAARYEWRLRRQRHR